MKQIKQRGSRFFIFIRLTNYRLSRRNCQNGLFFKPNSLMRGQQLDSFGLSILEIQPAWDLAHNRLRPHWAKRESAKQQWCRPDNKLFDRSVSRMSLFWAAKLCLWVSLTLNSNRALKTQQLAIQ